MTKQSVANIVSNIEKNIIGDKLSKFNDPKKLEKLRPAQREGNDNITSLLNAFLRSANPAKHIFSQDSLDEKSSDALERLLGKSESAKLFSAFKKLEQASEVQGQSIAERNLELDQESSSEYLKTGFVKLVRNKLNTAELSR